MYKVILIYVVYSKNYDFVMNNGVDVRGNKDVY